MADWFTGVRPGELIRRLRGRRDNTTLQDLEDAVQDVYLQALEKSRSGRPPAKPRNANAYFTRSVHNRLNSVRRSRWREVRGHTDDQLAAQLAADAIDDRSTPDDIHEARERAQLFRLLAERIMRGELAADDDRTARVFAAIQQRLAEALSDRHWVLLRMRVLHGVGVAQCAAVLGISIGGVHNWTHRALDIVRACLREFGVEPGAMEFDDD